MTLNTERTAFLDSLRTLMVLLVLVFHSAASYGSAVEFWPFHDRNPSKIIDLMMFILDMFMMSILFFIAGYFALPTFQKKGFWGFVKGKLIRLGVPWLVVTLLLLPILDYVHYWHNAAVNGSPMKGYFTYWLMSMRRIVNFHVGWMNMTTYTNMTDHFYQRYMWYVSLLILFFIFFALLFKVFIKVGRKIHHNASTGTSVWHGMALTGVVTIILFALVRFFLYSNFLDKGWFSLGNLIQFQCGKLVIYACYFALGVYAFSRKWFAGRNSLGWSWIWALGCLLLFGINMFILMKLNKTAGNILIFQLAFVVCYPLWTLSFLGLFLSFAAAHMNRSTPLRRNMTDHSYGMYLVHYAIPMTLPLLLSAFTGMAVSIKFSIVAVATLLVSYAMSRYVIVPFPRATIAGLIGLNIVLFVMV